jgi:endonuclease/exonuclease/phosphatase family metal-dependent hydrolase
LAGPSAAAEEAPAQATSVEAARPIAQHHKVLKVMTFNIRHGEHSSLPAIARMIRRVDPDVVGLQEVDESRNRSGNVRQAKRLGKLTGMHSSFQPALARDGGHYGVALLSDYRIVSSKKVPLPFIAGHEPRVLLKAKINVKGTPVTVGVTHLSHNSASERIDQIHKVKASLPDEGQGRSLLIGDLNTEPGTPCYNIARDDGYRDTWRDGGVRSGDTVPVGNPSKRIDYVLERGPMKTTRAYVVDAPNLSDHRPYVAKMKVRFHLGD